MRIVYYDCPTFSTSGRRGKVLFETQGGDFETLNIMQCDSVNVDGVIHPVFRKVYNHYHREIEIWVKGEVEIN